MKKLVYVLTFLAGTAVTFGQTAEELKAEQAPKKDSIAAI